MQICGQVKLTRTLYQWNLMLRASTEDGFFTETLKIYSSMVKSGVHGSNFTYPLVLKSCAKLCFIREGKMVHSHVLRMGFQADVFVQTALIDMYSKCSDLASSCQVFDEMPVRSLVSWNSMISACCRHSRVNEAFGLLKQMQLLDLEPSSATFVSIVSCCSFGQGLSIHSFAIKLGLHSELPLSNSLMGMYVHLGHNKDARSIFSLMFERSIISWTTILGGYVTIGDVTQVFGMFNQMRQESVSPDHIVFLNLISSCVQLRNLLLASSVYCVILKSGCDCEDPIDNLLVSMFAKCGDLVCARKVFDMVREKSVLVWTSLISGYTHYGKPDEAVELFKKLLGTTVRPNEITVATVLSACADLGSLSIGEEIEEYILRNGLESDLRIQTSLIHMFCKCGSIQRAKEVFERVSEKDLAVWSSMINGYAIHGMGEEALSLFHKMQLEEEIKPDAMMYTSVLLACNHSGLVKDGIQHFESMQRDFGIEPSIEHYLCMVDLLGRAGCLDLAMKTIQLMPVEVQSRVWAPFLSACRTHRNIELGEFATQKLLDMNPVSTGSYVLMSNFYTSVGKWKEAAVTRRLINEQGLVKEPGWSQIAVNGSFHVFIAGDRSHHQSGDIYSKLEELNIKLMEAGYIAETDLVIQDLEKEEKVEALKVHSERLAIAFGLISTEAGATLTIIKNLRTCDDCHTALKFISKITCRHLIVRDGQRFHHFESGLCSCKDYW